MTRAQRSTLIQWSAFVVGLAVIAGVLAVTVRGGALADRFFKWDDFTDQFPDIITEAARNTLVYTAIGYTGGLVIGLVVALMRQSNVPPARVLRPPPGHCPPAASPARRATRGRCSPRG